MKVYIHTPRLALFDYGPSHPFRMERLELTHRLIEACGLLKGKDVAVVEPEPARIDDLLTFHRPDYVEAIKRADSGRVDPGGSAFGLGSPDNPVFPGLFRYVLLYTGATLAAANLVASGEASAAFNMSGGLHHAMAGRASGFCYVNDIVVGIIKLLGTFDRVLYVDVDAHHGDGVQAAFYGSDRVLTVSFHESGRFLFPGTGFEDEIGEGPGEGFAVNFPFLPGAGDELYLECLREVVAEAAVRFKPRAIVAQMGADGLAGDPLAHLAISNRCLEQVALFLSGLGVPLVVLGGGGYDVDNVARAWTLIWAALIGVKPPEELPPSYVALRGRSAPLPKGIRDQAHGRGAPQRVRDDALRVKAYLLEKVVPLIHAKGRRR